MAVQLGVPVPPLDDYTPLGPPRGRAYWPEIPRNELEAHIADFDWLRSHYVADRVSGHYRRDRAHLRLECRPDPEEAWQQQLLAWLRDHVHHDLPRVYYQAVLGHDLHLGTFGSLHMQHYHAHFPDPFTGKLGWWENVGRVSQGKVGISFRDFEVLKLQGTPTTYADFKYHEVGLTATAEANTDTGLLGSSSIARVTGSQTSPAADQYRSVGTVTADANETWNEHGLFNTGALATPTLMDRSIVSPAAVVVISDTVQFTYTITKTAEA